MGIQVPESYEFEPTEKQPLEVEDRWWEIFEDGELDRLVEDALKYNWDIKQAAARILEVRARYVQVRSDRFPEVDVGGIRDRRQINGGESRDNFIVDTYERPGRISSPKKKIDERWPRPWWLKLYPCTWVWKPWKEGCR
jgi:multidrug efflux system outer membrane protein